MNKEIARFAADNGADYLCLDRISGFRGLFNRKLWIFRIEALKRMWKLPRLRRSIERIYEVSDSSDKTIAGVYDAEYGESGRPNYLYLNHLLFKREFERIVGIPAGGIKNLKIIDIGAGSNEFLRFCHSELGVDSNRLFGSDVSTASRDLIIRDGFRGFLGRIEDIGFPEKDFDAVFLSYFIDYDTDQKRTFEEAVRIVRPGGRIILEGKFPSVPFGLSRTDRNRITFITKGVDALEDIKLVCEAFLEVGQVQGKNISLERIVQSRRRVFSHYGSRSLPSYFLVFSSAK